MNRDRISRLAFSSFTIICALCVVPSDAKAQDVGSSPAAAPRQRAAGQPDDSGLADIVVTAQRRSESVIAVPLAITAISGENLAESGIRDITSLRFNTPGFNSYSGTGYTQLFIRGIGNRVLVGADPSVATFIDEVPRPYGALVDNFLNVERVEVLKGAQGGLYGRNATGGVVNIITRQPAEAPAMRARVTGGTRDTIDASGYVNLPMSEAVAANVSLTRQYHRGYVRNLATPTPYSSAARIFNPATGQLVSPNSVIATPALNDQDVWSADGKVRLQLGDTITATLGGDYTRKNDAGGNGWVQRDPAAAYGTYVFLAGLFGLSEIRPGPFPIPPERSSFASIPTFSKNEDYGGSLRVVAGLPGVDLTSITAVRWSNSQFSGDLGAAPVPIAGFSTDFRRRFFYQELRAVSTGTGPLQFLGGVNYFRDKVDNLITNILLGFPAGTTTATTRTKSYSAYAEIGYDLTDRLKLTGSLRYVHDTKPAFYPAQSGLPEARAEQKGDKLIPAATLSYALDDGTVYARYANGYKSGGINPIVSPAAISGTSDMSNIFEPETVDLFEVGYRTNLFDRRVQFTSAVFYNSYKSLQVTRTGNPGIPFIILNAGSARSYGAEASVAWRVVPSLTVGANIGYLNGKYKDFLSPGSPTTGVLPFDSSGNVLALAAKWQGGANINLDQPISENLNIAGTVLYSFISRFNFEDEANPLVEQKGYSLVNFRIGVKTSDDRLGAYFFVNNLFDKFYNVFKNRSAAGVTSIEGSPRILGGTVELSF